MWNVQESDGELDSAMSDSVIDETESVTEMDIDMTQPAVQRGKGRGGGGVEKEEVVEREEL